MATNAEAGPSPEARQEQFEQAVAYSLHLWLPLRIAVQNGWGEGDAADKRDWFVGAIADLFPSFAATTAAEKNRKDPIAEDVEDVLLQVMWDEFEANVDDQTEAEVAAAVLKARAACAEGDFAFVDELRRRWVAIDGKKVAVPEPKAEDQETDEDDDEDDEDDEDEDEDVAMKDEAPPLVAVPKEKPAQVVDDDGFMTVDKNHRKTR
ncbi:Pre-rRNA-processing protein TSR2-domain-containing protein [Xylariomycetidae sp. FL0641]|nr:Pre-rRNA-processing protein TSR2-domain-containing protein [Xylariomycetidae sp. FL0641]